MTTPVSDKVFAIVSTLRDMGIVGTLDIHMNHHTAKAFAHELNDAIGKMAVACDKDKAGYSFVVQGNPVLVNSIMGDDDVTVWPRSNAGRSMMP